jgi:hypothetical protein
VKRVQLIVTGEMEKCALHGSLGRLFPDAEFVAPRFVNGFTSTRLTSVSPQAPRQGISTKPNINKLAQALIADVEPGSRRTGHVDLVIAVDDLELCNQDQAGMVTERFGRAVQEELDARDFNGDSRRRVGEKLRTRCSFHLFSPMTEAYFFGEKAALTRAGSKRSNCFPADLTDIEAFHVNDPDFEKVAEGVRPWAIRPSERQRHPKHYLGFLCTPVDDSLSEKNEIRHYRETRQGTAALEMLDWRMILSQSGHGLFARSMIADIADALDRENPAPGECAPETLRRDNGLLRNLPARP